MSGRKYTTIDSNELSRLRQDAAKFRGLRKDLPDRIENIVRDTCQHIDRRLTPIENRQREYERALQGMSQEMRQVEQRMAQKISQHARETRAELQKSAERMERQKRELRQEIHQTAEELRNANQETEKKLTRQIKATETRLLRLNQEVRNEMRQQEQRLNDAIEQERREREAGIRAVNERVNAIEQNHDRLRNLAEQRINDALIQQNFIEENYPHEHLLPGKLESLKKALRTAQNTLHKDGAVEAALAQANTTFQDLSDLRIELERLDSEWRIWQEQAIRTAQRILNEAQQNRNLPNVEEAGEISEVNYWTQGGMACLEKDLHRVLKAAGNEEYPLSIPEMKKLVEETLPEMNQRLDKLIEEALIAVERSQLRVSIADIAAGIFETEGFTIVDSTYEGEDMRSGFFIKAKNPQGSEIVAAVTPEGSQEKLTLDNFDVDQMSPAELQNRANNIAKAMQQHNLQADTPAQESPTPSRENRDIQEVRKRKPKLQSLSTNS